MITTKELRQKYLAFFQAKKHAIISGASLIPENDPSVLFTTAGMHPLVPYLLGEKHPSGPRLADYQKCIRTGDIDEVGDNSHCTFFEMLGNWSLGDYFKKEAIEFSFEFLTKELNIPINKLAVTVFAGDNDALRDEESAQIWESLGLPKHKISYLGKKDNWWGPAGQTGPCGPDTEMFYWVGVGEPGEESNPGNDETNWLEIWNDVFMQYDKQKRTLLIDGMEFLYDDNFVINDKVLQIINNFSGKKILVVNGFADKAKEILANYNIEVYSFGGELKKEDKEFFIRLQDDFKLKSSELFYIDHSDANLKGAKAAGIANTLVSDGNNLAEVSEFISKNSFYYKQLEQKNVDTGMGLERTTAILNGFDNVYEVDIIKPVYEKVKELANDKANLKAIRIITDHIRAAVMIMGDDRGVGPSNLDQGYVVRRLIRTAIRRGREIGIMNSFVSILGEFVIEVNKDMYPELERNRQKVISELMIEEEKFSKVLGRGEEMIKEYIKDGKISSDEAFQLYSTYGYPIEEIQKLGVVVDMIGFNSKLKEHQDLSRQGAEQKFKGGLADNSVETTKLHTATHLLHTALRKVLGDHVAQKGSNITADRLRFDFSHPDKMTVEQIKQVEDLVNQAIANALPVSWQEMTVEQAKELGALGLFNQKYGDKVKVYTVGQGNNIFSREICGGPHVENSRELGKFIIQKEQASSSGIRRIKAVLE